MTARAMALAVQFGPPSNRSTRPSASPSVFGVRRRRRRRRYHHRRYQAITALVRFVLQCPSNIIRPEHGRHAGRRVASKVRSYKLLSPPNYIQSDSGGVVTCGLRYESHPPPPPPPMNFIFFAFQQLSTNLHIRGVFFDTTKTVLSNIYSCTYKNVFSPPQTWPSYATECFTRHGSFSIAYIFRRIGHFPCTFLSNAYSL